AGRCRAWCSCGDSTDRHAHAGPRLSRRRLRYPSPMRKDPVEHLLRALYSAALYLLVPVTVYHLIWRGFRQPEYFQRWNERYAAYGAQAHAETVWIHAVSVGEVGAAAPLINALLRERPALRLPVGPITPPA